MNKLAYIIDVDRRLCLIKRELASFRLDTNMDYLRRGILCARCNDLAIEKEKLYYQLTVQERKLADKAFLENSSTDIVGL